MSKIGSAASKKKFEKVNGLMHGWAEGWTDHGQKVITKAHPEHSSGELKMEVLQVDNSVKNGQNLPISNLKADLHNINAHTKFGENLLIFTKIIIWK